MATLKVSSGTDIGREREINEDAAASLVFNAKNDYGSKEFGILVVADGIGGYDKGEIASNLAVSSFVDEILSRLSTQSLPESSQDFAQLLLTGVKFANEKVRFESLKRSHQLGTTLVGAIICDGVAHIVNVGDSRAYLVSDSKSIRQISKDHSAVQEMIDAGIISKEEGRNHPRKNLITRSLGSQIEIRPDVFEVHLQGETLLLCSDGLHGMLGDSEISEIINHNLTESLKNLISKANHLGGRDNIGIAMCRFV